jgi:23S rRNA G2069 N7-methylase RlmK/C1962 C5-methylase RlmI
MIEGSVKIVGGREKKLQHGYPWVQRGEISDVSGAPTPGGLVRVVNFRNEMLGIGTYNPQSRFPVRMLTTEDEPIDRAFFERRLERALRYRQRVVQDTNAMRILFSESDGLPGLIADQYADYLVVQVRTLGMERLRELWLPTLIERLEPKGVLERSEMASRAEEGLEPVAGVLHGEVPEVIEIEESGLTFLVPTDAGRKTGFYLDQRENRRRLAQRVQPGERVLDMFCYTGAFALYAARAGAYAVGVDILPDAIDLAEVHARRNRLEAHWIVGKRLRLAAPSRRTGGAVRLDCVRPARDCQAPRPERLAALGDLETGIPCTAASVGRRATTGVQLRLPIESARNARYGTLGSDRSAHSPVRGGDYLPSARPPVPASVSREPVPEVHLGAGVNGVGVSPTPRRSSGAGSTSAACGSGCPLWGD